jgi:hypothetical protein
MLILWPNSPPNDSSATKSRSTSTTSRIVENSRNMQKQTNTFSWAMTCDSLWFPLWKPFWGSAASEELPLHPARLQPGLKIHGGHRRLGMGSKYDNLWNGICGFGLKSLPIPPIYSSSKPMTVSLQQSSADLPTGCVIQLNLQYQETSKNILFCPWNIASLLVFFKSGNIALNLQEN